MPMHLKDTLSVVSQRLPSDGGVNPRRSSSKIWRGSQGSDVDEMELKKFKQGGHNMDIVLQNREVLAHLQLQQGPQNPVLDITKQQTQIIRGQQVKQIDLSTEFCIKFKVRLAKRPADDCNILLFAAASQRDSALPSVGVRAHSAQLVLKLIYQQLRIELDGPEEGMTLDRVYSVTVELKVGTLSFTVNGHKSFVSDVELRKLMEPVSVYISSPFNLSAPGYVDELTYEDLVPTANRRGSRSSAVEHTHKADRPVDLPPAERRLLEVAAHNIRMNRTWAQFDTFFGIFLIANSFIIGIEIQHKREGESIWRILEIMFILIFIIELVLRIKISRFKSWREMFRDLWFVFDFFIVVLSILEVSLPEQGFPGYISVFRIIRLLKLARMVRLVRFFRELGLLVEGLLNSFQTLFWTFALLFITLYISAILLVRTARLGIDETNPYTEEELKTIGLFLDLFQTMWKLVQMVTFDDWATVIRDLAHMDRYQGTVLAIELLFFISFAGLGIMNMVVGIMSHTAFHLNQKYRSMQGVERLLQQQVAMKSLEEALRSWGERPLFQNDQFIGTDELFDAISRTDLSEGAREEDVTLFVDTDLKMTPAQAARELNLTGDEVLSLCDVFAENGFIEINGLIEAIKTKELQSYFGLKKSSLVVTKITSRLRPADMVCFNFISWELDQLMKEMERNITSACTMAFDTMRCLREQAMEADTLWTTDKASGWSPPVEKLEFPSALLDTQELERVVALPNIENKESELYLVIDSVFGFIIVCNGIFVGLQVATQGADSAVVYFIDLVFTILFTVEFILRLSLFTHTERINQLGHKNQTLAEISVIKSKELNRLIKRMKFWMIPPCPPGGCGTVCTNLPKMLMDTSHFLDFAIITLSVIDSLIMEILAFLQVDVPETSIASGLRVFRLFRLAKLLRIFRVFPFLQMLMFALIGVWRTVLWSFALMLLIIYAHAIYGLVVFNIEEDAQGNPIIEAGEEVYLIVHDKFFRFFEEAILTGWRLACIDDWGEIINYTSDVGLQYSMVCFFVYVVLGLGLMKMIIGVMCESAITLTQTGDRDSQRENLVEFIKEMENLRALFWKELGTDIIAQEFFENALGLKLRPKRQMPISESAPGELRLSPDAMKVGMSRNFSNQLVRIFARAKLPPDLVKQTFEKIDHDRTGFVQISNFVSGALVLKEDFSKLELFASIIGIREVRGLCAELEEMVRQTHSEMEAFIQDTCTLINRKTYEGPGVRSAHQQKQVTPGRFGQAAQEALAELSSWEGSVPSVKSSGRLKLSAGRGKLRFSGDEAEGINTQLRSEVKPGDILIVQPTAVEENLQQQGQTGGQPVPMTMNVSGIIGHNRIKLAQRVTHVEPDALHTYMIAKHVGQEREHISGLDDSNFTHTVHLQNELTPRSAELFFDWELQTRRRHDPHLQGLLKDKVQLMGQLQELNHEIEALQNPVLARKVFKAFREILMARKRQNVWSSMMGMSVS